MRARLVIGPVLLAVIAGLFVLDQVVLDRSRPFLPAIIALMALLGWIELARMTGLAPGGERGDRGTFVLGGAGVLFFHGLAWFEGRRELDSVALARAAPGAGGVAAGTSAPHGSFEELAVLGIFGVVLLAVLLAVVPRRRLAPLAAPGEGAPGEGPEDRRGELEARLRNALETIFGVLLLGLLFSYHTRIYLIPSGALVLAVVYFAGIKGTDIVAYLVGSTLGRHRFLVVSPKKTLEGFAGGIAWGAAAFGTAGLLWPEILFPWPVGVLSGIILAVVAQAGDLGESLIKRVYGTKDSGGLLPEFGGVLDLIDSLVFTALVYWHLVAS